MALFVFDASKGIEVLTQLATIVAALFGIVAFRAYTTSVKQFSFGVMKHCIDSYVGMLDKIKPEMDGAAVSNYLELVNQELFYFQQNYLPLEVTIEWLDGIISIVPIFDSKLQVINSLNSIQLLQAYDNDYMRNFSRVKRCFQLSDVKDFSKAFSTAESPYDPNVRKELIIAVLSKLRKLSRKERKEIKAFPFWI